MGILGKDKSEDKKVSAFTEKRKAKKEIVKTFLESDEGKAITGDVLEAIKYLAGMGARSQGMQISSELKTMLEAGEVSSIDIFTKFGYGAPTMAKKIRDFIKAEPANRIWVVFEGGNYSIAGHGANAPNGWTGFVPVEEASL